MKIFSLTGLILFVVFPVFSQEVIMSNEQKNLFDSLENRTKYLEKEIPRLKRTRNLNLYYKKLELEKTRFVYEYEKLVFEEDLMEAEALLNAKTKAALKLKDKSLISYYEEYHSDLIEKMKKQAIRYQELFAKEKTFKKEIYKYVDIGDEYNILRAQRIVELAIKYAQERQLKTTLKYLIKYKVIIEAEVFNFYSDYDLPTLANNERQFEKEINTLIESDSLSDIIKAQEIFEDCYEYSSIIKTKLDKKYYDLQRNRILKAISDFQKRQGDSQYLEEFTNQAITVKLDSLNQKGVYRWKDYIVVIDELKPYGQSKNVQKGEAIIDADKKLIEYIRINRLAKIGKEVKVGPTILIPYKSTNSSTYFKFNPDAKKWQYIVCYTRVKNEITTKKVNALLPPLQFEHENKEN